MENGIYDSVEYTDFCFLGKYLSFPVAYWLRHYAASRKVAGSSPDEVDFFLIHLILPAAICPWGRLSL
jgi:hypothetical protein